MENKGLIKFLKEFGMTEREAKEELREAKEELRKVKDIYLLSSKTTYLLGYDNPCTMFI